MTFLAVLSFCLSFSEIASTQSGAKSSAKKPVTFSKDVAPVLQKQCASCHRSGGTAPMSLLTYTDARPWAKSIREKVLQREMPPWHADPHYGEFVNERRLSQAEINTIVAWVDGGTLKGEEKDQPAPVVFNDTWRIGKPDVVFEMPQEHVLAAEGPDEYQYFVIPTDFKEDRWIQAGEAIPGNNKVVHHIIAFIQPPPRPRDPAAQTKPSAPRSGNIIFYKDGTLMRVNASVPTFDNGCLTPEGGAGILTDGSMKDGMPALLCGQAPGRDADVWPAGYAKRLPAGAKILLQIHYAKNGSVERDRSKVGLIFAKTPPEKEIFTEAIRNHYFVIPPGADNHEVKACYTFPEDVQVLSLMPHMHLRGKDMEFKAISPSGGSEILLRVPNYSFNWQTTYYLRKPIAIAKGTRFEVNAHFDNSPKNKDNPDPSKTVRWGDPTYDEMMIGWVDYARDSQAPVTAGQGGAAK